MAEAPWSAPFFRRKARRRLPLTPPLHLYLLGDFLLVLGDAPVTTVDWPRLQSLLAYLMTCPRLITSCVASGRRSSGLPIPTCPGHSTWPISNARWPRQNKPGVRLLLGQRSRRL